MRSRTRPDTGPGARRGERGASLAEALVTITILAVAVVGVLGAMAGSIRASDLHRRHASAEVAVRSGAEAIKDRGLAYVPCATAGSYAAALPSPPAGVSLSVTSVQVWDGISSNPVNFGSCPGTDPGMQRITVSASSAGVTEVVTIIKRRT